MNTIRLSNRLLAAAELCGESERVADVGTDHGYVPIWLLKSGRAQYVIASDINPEPLENARRNAELHGTKNGLELILSGGISHLRADSAETIIIAGMGGETIADILSRASWVSDGRHRLILQPMTKQSELIDWLYRNGLFIKRARLAEDNGEIYIVLLAEGGSSAPPSGAARIIPEALMAERTPLLSRYLELHIKRISNALEGMKSSKGKKDPERIAEYERILEELMFMKGGLQCLR